MWWFSGGGRVVVDGRNHHKVLDAHEMEKREEREFPYSL